MLFLGTTPETKRFLFGRDTDTTSTIDQDGLLEGDWKTDGGGGVGDDGLRERE